MICTINKGTNPRNTGDCHKCPLLNVAFGPTKKSWLPGCILVVQSLLPLEAHQSWELSHKPFTPSWCFQSNQLVNTTPKIKGGLNNKAFIIAQVIARSGRQFMGWWHGDWKNPSQVSYENSVPEDKPSLQATSRTQIRSFGRKLGQVYTLITEKGMMLL